MTTTTPTKEKVFPGEEKRALPRAFVMRRLHSLLGLWIVIYLFEHLLVNSLAAFYTQDNGAGFISLVNKIHAIPYLRVVELLLLAFPFLVHAGWGMFYAMQGKMNSKITDGSAPSLPQYPRNRAYSWQRITSWILVVGILAHVIQMRFVENPLLVHHDLSSNYIIKLNRDAGLYDTAEKLGTQLYTKSQMLEEEQKIGGIKKLKENQVIAVAPSAGAAYFLVVRETFKSPLMVILYSILVIASAYHAFNGLWTFLITWGIIITRRAQSIFRKICNGLMFIVSVMGLMAAWGVYITFQIHT